MKFVDNKSIVSVTDIKCAVLRMIMRCLTSNLKSSYPVRQYLIRPDFWNVDENSIEAVLEFFPNNVQLKDAWVTF